MTNGETLPTALTGQSLKVSNIMPAATVRISVMTLCSHKYCIHHLIVYARQFGLGLSVHPYVLHPSPFKFGNYQQHCVLFMCKSWWWHGRCLVVLMKQG